MAQLAELRVRLPGLRDLCAKSVHGEGADAACFCARLLRTLSLNSRSVTQESVEAALGAGCALPQIVELDLSGCSLVAVPHCLTALPTLQTLDLHDNSIAAFGDHVDAALSAGCWPHLRVFVVARRHRPRTLKCNAAAG